MVQWMNLTNFHISDAFTHIQKSEALHLAKLVLNLKLGVVQLFASFSQSAVSFWRCECIP